MNKKFVTRVTDWYRFKSIFSRWYHNKRAAFRAWLIKDVTSISYSNDTGFTVFFTDKYCFHKEISQIIKSDFKNQGGKHVIEYEDPIIHGVRPIAIRFDGEIKGLYPPELKKDDEQRIRIFWDGDWICALQGENIQEGNAGFGDTIPRALENLAKDLRGEK